MSYAKQANGKNLSNSHDSDYTTIKKMFVEHGVRQVHSTKSNTDDLPIATSTIEVITKQHDDEQRELQELNSKLSDYLGRVHNLEQYNERLSLELARIKGKWCTTGNQVDSQYISELKLLRNSIDNSLRDQILLELQLQRFECDIDLAQKSIKGLSDHHSNRLNLLQRDLNISKENLEQIKDQFDRRSTDLIQYRTNINNLLNEYDALQNELVNHRLERLMIDNELQTLGEDLAFQNAVYQTEREGYISFNKPVFDVSQFYLNELNNAIISIRQDFDILSQSQMKELEEFYRIKTQEIHETAQQNQRKRLLELQSQNEETTLDSSLSIEFENTIKRLNVEYEQLQMQFDNMLNDLNKIQYERMVQGENLEEELNQLQNDISVKQAVIDDILTNNVSLRFELLTYRRLLNSEEQRLNRLEHEQTLQKVPSTLYQNQNNGKTQGKDFTIQKMSVKTTTTGPIIFDSVDLLNDSITLKYDKSSGKEQSLANWGIVRQNDKQSGIVFRFPETSVLKPRQSLRILSKHSPLSNKTDGDFLIADKIDGWGLGQVMVTRLIDATNNEVASITQTRIP